MSKRRQKCHISRETLAVAAHPSSTITDQPHARWSWAQVCLGLAILGAAAVLLFARLGHYALWDDEATTALSALGVWRTGDTVAIIDHNIIAYRAGAELRHLRLRYLPPLPSYLAAPFVGLGGHGALPARLPFALCGMACVLLLVWWLWQAQACLLTWALLGGAILGNVSLWLYFRQARYYSVAILASVVMAYLYLHRHRRRGLIAFTAASLCLLAANYLNYVAFYACLAVDYLLWSRKRQPLQRRDWLVLFLPQIVIGGPLVLIWNPLSRDVTQYQATNVLADKIVLLWWNLRDLDRCEFGVSLLLVLAPVLSILVRDLWLLRGTVALLVYIAVITLCSPQAVGQTVAADVRYLAPLIPLCAFLGMAVVRVISRGHWWLAAPLALVAFATNALQLYPFSTGALRSTIALYVRELCHPPHDPYRAAAQWINSHVQARQSIWVVPHYMTYPLMYHAPQAIYAWQLTTPQAPQFVDLEPIHFQGVVPPDYVIAFGPVVRQAAKVLRGLEAAGIAYTQVETLDIYWQPLYRPELIWRTFEPITRFDRTSQAISIFQRIRPPFGPGVSVCPHEKTLHERQDGAERDQADL